MSGRNIVLLLLAVVIAVGTAVAVRSKLNTATAPLPAAVATSKVLVAKSAIPTGTFVNAAAELAWQDWPQANLLPTYITEGSRPAEEFNGAVARRPIQPGEPITASALMKPGDGGFMSAVLSPGMRAVSIGVNATSGNAGFVFPGDRVDLILTHKITVGSSGGESAGTQQDVVVSETFVEDVRVLAVDQMLDNPENKAVLAKTVTLEVTSKQAEKINVAVNLGMISVALRSLGQEAEKDKAAAADELVDPFFPEDGALPAERSDEHITRASEVSKVLSNSNYNAQVNVIRGNALEKMQFIEKAQ